MGGFVKKGRASGPAFWQAALTRSDTVLLNYAIMLFQATALVLLAFKTNPVDWQALRFAAILPACTVLLTRLLPRIWKIDRVLLSLMLFLCSVSIVTLKDIARSPKTPLDQAVFMAVGLAGMLLGILFMRVVRNFRSWTPLIMIASALLLFSPIVFGKWMGGAKNWIPLGDSYSVQPSEFVKIALVLALAASFTRHEEKRWTYLAVVFAAGLCALLLYERDLGALLLYFLTTIILYALATSNLAVAGLGLGAGAAGAYAAYHLFDYVKKRVTMWQDPWSDPLDGGYQIIQALIAIGSGGLLGMGLGLGLPRNIPLYASDFVFAAICEEFGAVFTVCLLIVYVLILLRGISVAMNARDSLHALTAFGVVTMLALQTLLIVAGNIRLVPLTGVTLPFIAAGGSSIVSCMTSMGLLLGISSINADQDAQDAARAQWREEALR